MAILYLYIFIVIHSDINVNEHILKSMEINMRVRHSSYITSSNEVYPL